MNMEMPQRPVALIVDDHDAVRRALCDRIQTSFQRLSVREASSVDEALRIVEAEKVDLVLMDFRLPGMDGVDGTREVLARSPETNVVMVSGFDDFSHRSAASKAGARAFVCKRAIGRELIPAIESLAGAASW
jgi:DNA-binding NarL/FixJ family response regulator